MSIIPLIKLENIKIKFLKKKMNDFFQTTFFFQFEILIRNTY